MIVVRTHHYELVPKPLVGAAHDPGYVDTGSPDPKRHGPIHGVHEELLCVGGFTRWRPPAFGRERGCEPQRMEAPHDVNGS